MSRDATLELLAGLIDYAGLFPPASESMRMTMRHYQTYRTSAQSWILGRLIVPLDRLDEFRLEWEHLPVPSVSSVPWRISCLWPATAIDSAATIADACDRMQGCVAQINLGGSIRIEIDTVEVPSNDPEAIHRLDNQLPDNIRGYVEVAGTTVAIPCLDTLKQSRRLAAKVRSGGVTPEAIPDADHLAEFLSEATARQLPFKCTAGLHHPLPAARPLTYQTDAPIGTMHGFWNVAIATGLLLSESIDLPTVRDLLLDQEASSFHVRHDQLSWKSYRLSQHDIEQLRKVGFQSFGSCSFQEPVTDLQQLGWLPAVSDPLLTELCNE